jgi:hypothetical protein
MSDDSPIPFGNTVRNDSLHEVEKF